MMDRAPAKLLFLFSYLLCRWLLSCYFSYCYFFCSLCGHPITCPSPVRFKNLPRKDSLRLTQGSPHAMSCESSKTTARVIFTRYCPNLINWGFLFAVTHITIYSILQEIFILLIVYLSYDVETISVSCIKRNTRLITGSNVTTIHHQKQSYS
jgi:hypothetical protein